MWEQGANLPLSKFRLHEEIVALSSLLRKIEADICLETWTEDSDVELFWSQEEKSKYYRVTITLAGILLSPPMRG